MTQTPLAREEFTAVFRQHPAGVAVVTLLDGDRPVGFTATSVISVSAEPPIFAFSINNTSSSWPALERAERVTANLLELARASCRIRQLTQEGAMKGRQKRKR